MKKRLILYEDRVYKVSEKEFQILEDLQKKVDKSGETPDLYDYIEKNISKYKFVGFIELQARR